MPSHLKIHVMLFIDIVVVMLLCSMLEINDDVLYYIVSRDVPTRRHTVHGKMLHESTTMVMPREENNAVVGETGAPFYRRNTIGTTENTGRIKQGHPNSRDLYTPGTRRIRKNSDTD